MSEIYNYPILITKEYLAKNSPVPINYDFEEIRPFITIAENIYIVPILGKQLYDELIDQVTDNTVTDVNSTLLLELYQLESFGVMVESLPFIRAHVTEKGITLGKSDNSDSIDSNDLNELMTHLKSQITVLTKKLEDFLERNAECYPKYSPKNCCCNVVKQNFYLYNSNNRKKKSNY